MFTDQESVTKNRGGKPAANNNRSFRHRHGFYLLVLLRSKTAPSNFSDTRYSLLVVPRESRPKIVRIGSGKTRCCPKIPPQDGLRCSIIGSVFRKTGVKVSSIAVTLKQWWRDVGLCPKSPRTTIGSITSTTKHRCRRARPMGHSLSMCKLQQCRHKKSKF